VWEKGSIGGIGRGENHEGSPDPFLDGQKELSETPGKKGVRDKQWSQGKVTFEEGGKGGTPENQGGEDNPGKEKGQARSRNPRKGECIRGL